MSIQNLLVPGGLGFVGSNTVVELLQQTTAGLVIVDDLSSCFEDVLERIKLIVSNEVSGEQFDARVEFVKGNILDLAFLEGVFSRQKAKGTPIDGIMHFAAKKAIGESYQFPIMYFENNILGSINLFKMMEANPECKNFIFSSTAGVYGNRDNCKEEDVKDPGSPYGESKSCVEMLMADLARVHPEWRIVSLRYFNPVGAHPSGLIGDEPSGFPANLMPFIQEVIIGKRPQLTIFGSDYPTPDGTCIRDYIHISDLAAAHLIAFNLVARLNTSEVQIYNLGSGRGHSVKEIVKEYAQALGREIPHKMGDRRQGDVPCLIANVDKARKQLGWTTKKTLSEMCGDSVKFIKKRFNLD